MRYKIDLPPGRYEKGQWYWMRRFCYLPRIIGGHVVWLEVAERYEQFWVQPSGTWFWYYRGAGGDTWRLRRD